MNDAAASHVPVALFVPLEDEGTFAKVQVYAGEIELLAGTVCVLPPVIEQDPPASVRRSARFTEIASQSLGFVTVMFPLTFQLLVVTLTV